MISIHMDISWIYHEIIWISWWNMSQPVNHHLNHAGFQSQTCMLSRGFRHLARKGESCTVLPNNSREAEASQSCDLSFYVFLGISWHLKSCKRRKPKGTPCSNSTNKPVPRIPQHSCPATRGLIGAPTRPISCYHAIDQWGLATIGVPIEVDGLTEEDLWKPLTLLWLVIFRW